jgi:hypothetical protein
VTLFACTSVRAQSQTGKISTFNLETYGWQPLPTNSSEQPSEWPGGPSQQVSIDHKGRVLVGFTVRENYGLATRERPGLSFHILRFSSEGKVDLSFALPTKDYFTTGLYLGSSDQIIFARANDALQFLSEENGARREGADWQTLAPCSAYCRISYSPSRATLILETLNKANENSNATYTIIDGSTFPPHIVQTCTRMAFHALKITDKFAYWDGVEGHEPFTRRFSFCDVDHPQELPLGWGGLVHVLNDDAFLRLAQDSKQLRGEIALVDSRGQVKFRHEMHKHEVPRYLAGYWVPSDEKGNRFACVADTRKGGSRFLDTSGKLVARRIVVFNDKGQELASIPVSTTYHRDFDFSLSPDGHRLAILDQGVLTVADLE